MSFEVEIKMLPSFRVVSIGETALTTELGVQNKSITEQVQGSGGSLLEWARSIGLKRDLIEGMYGMSIIEGGWTQAEGLAAAASKEKSQVFHQGLLINQGELNYFVGEKISPVPKDANPEEIRIRHTRPGIYAVARIQGPYESLSDVAETLMTKWLPSTDYRYSNEPLLNIYRNDPDSTNREELLTDFCIPLEGFNDVWTQDDNKAFAV